MSVRTKTAPTEAQCTLTVTGPRASAAAALLALRTLGFVETELRTQGSLGGPSHLGDPSSRGRAVDDGLLTGGEAAEAVPWRAVFPPLADAERPGRMLRAARAKEALSQGQLAQLTGIPQHHLSEMEHGKRTIGKERAKKLAEALQVHFSVFL